ncbi:hypothetical protein SKAU_G00235640 [Synaphobranchus kaupii]|uniref:SAM domain-containing protein n=1 Tax=Synaphobranchus kaupii TaxID=118154 RepID=A0A9Q1IRN5_SYNKA|nr:hypothetical protein SKAU_G00235640 [Synaphobranchus kaupii]
MRGYSETLPPWLLPTLNIYAWTEEHVHFWMGQIFGAGEGACDMQMYADLFKENHITGRRLLMLTETDMKDLGVRSKGHIIHLKSEIEKLTNDYLGLFHFPPLRKHEGAEEEDDEKKVIGLELVFGYHWKPDRSWTAHPRATRQGRRRVVSVSVSQQLPDASTLNPIKPLGTAAEWVVTYLDCKWKMYMELDGDEVAITYIKDVTFNANRPDVDVVKMTKPPFVMDKWIVGLWGNQVVDCMVNYENNVRSPKVTRHSHAIQWNPISGRDDIITLELVIQSVQSDMEGKPRSRSNSDVDPWWMFSLRQKQLKSESEQQCMAVTPFSCSEAKTLPQFLSMFGNQASYAAAVRRSPSRSPLLPRMDSRSLSPTSGLSKRLSSAHLGSKGSSPSSTTSESASERERPLSSGAWPGYRKNSCPGHLSMVAGNSRDMRFTTGSRPGRGRPRSLSSSTQPHSHFRVIPGISTPPTNTRTEPEEAKTSEGGWIKVERLKKSQKQDNKQVRGRPWRGGRGFRGRS